MLCQHLIILNDPSVVGQRPDRTASGSGAGPRRSRSIELTRLRATSLVLLFLQCHLMLWKPILISYLLRIPWHALGFRWWSKSLALLPPSYLVHVRLFKTENPPNSRNRSSLWHDFIVLMVSKHFSNSSFPPVHHGLCSWALACLEGVQRWKGSPLKQRQSALRHAPNFSTGFTECMISCGK